MYLPLKLVLKALVVAASLRKFPSRNVSGATVATLRMVSQAPHMLQRRAVTGARGKNMPREKTWELRLNATVCESLKSSISVDLTSLAILSQEPPGYV